MRELRSVAKAAVVTMAGLLVIVATAMAVGVIGDSFAASTTLLATVVLVGVTAQYVRLTAEQVRASRDQVSASERALSVTNERAAKQQSLEYCAQFVKEFVPAIWKFRDELAALKLPLSFQGEVGDFTAASVTGEARKAGDSRRQVRSGVVARNLLEVFATAFMYGIADEKIAYAVDGRAFCGHVARIYDCLALGRSAAEPETWQPIVDLYSLWKYRLTNDELAEERKKLDAQLAKASAIEAVAPKPIGV